MRAQAAREKEESESGGHVAGNVCRAARLQSERNAAEVIRETGNATGEELALPVPVRCHNGSHPPIGL